MLNDAKIIAMCLYSVTTNRGEAASKHSQFEVCY